MSLFVRAGYNDNLVVDQMVAPAASGLPFGRGRVPMDGLVLDATSAANRPSFRDSCEAAGLPLMIDPLTHLFQDEQEPGKGWAALGFAGAAKADPDEFDSAGVQDELIERALTFQLDHGATTLIAPYFHARSLKDPWFRIQLSINKRTASFVRSEGVHVPIAGLLAGSLRAFGPVASWAEGVDAFITSFDGVELRHVLLALSTSVAPAGDTEDRLGTYLSTVGHVSRRVPVIAWRQGQYGLAAVASGAVGYQTGPASDERCDLPGHGRNRRPQPGPDRSGGTSRRVYFGAFGRSVSARAAEILLTAGSIRGGLTCTSPACCPDGASSMLSSWRQHAIRARSRELDELASMPDASWRLNHVAREAERAADRARVANEILAGAGLTEHVPEGSYRALAAVTDALRDAARRQAS